MEREEPKVEEEEEEKEATQPESAAQTARRRSIEKQWKHKASQLFGCHWKQCTSFLKVDPFNLKNEVGGIITRKEGPMGGSIYITEVNGKPVEKQLIFGTPKLAYPYRSDENTYKEFPKECVSYFLSEKWNGINVLFFKYRDAENGLFLSAKSKGSAFLANSPYGNFFDLALEALAVKEQGNQCLLPLSSPPSKLKKLAAPEVQSESFELCGQKEPHLVKYAFAIELKPLFYTLFDGSIRPAVGENQEDIGPLPFSQEKVVADCSAAQALMAKQNEQYRAANKLQHKYEHNHFIVEGKVLYLLNDKGLLLNRTMYKIKPPDIEEVHWSNFDNLMQGRVREAVEKCRQREKAITAANLRDELDMGPKEWSRFGPDVMKYAKNLSDALPSFSSDKRLLLVLAGLPGSGTEQLAHSLKQSGWTVVDDENSNEDARNILAAAFKQPTAKAVVCRLNATANQRARWTATARELGILNVILLFFDMPKDACLQRCMSDVHHKFNQKVFDDAVALLKKPQRKEDFTKTFVVTSEIEAQAALASLATSSSK